MLLTISAIVNRGENVDIIHSKDAEIEFNCPMDLYFYPFDKQVSYFYNLHNHND